jgi:ATP-dependent RNA helicase RhlB
MFLKRFIKKLFKKRRTALEDPVNSTNTNLSDDTKDADKPSSPSTIPVEKKHWKEIKKRRRPKTHSSIQPEETDRWHISQFQVLPIEGKTRFHDFNLPAAVMHGVADANFHYCTPIQAEILQKTLSGSDAIGKAQTGTGKTAAFLVTIFNHLSTVPLLETQRKKTPRSLILAPTRELVLQIVKDAELLGKYCSCNIIPIIGGTDYMQQINKLSSNPVDIVAATPGRLLDLVRKKHLILSQVEILIIDEADRMLDMGFIPDVRTIVYKTPQKGQRQTLFFSATLTSEVTQLAAQWTNDPVLVDIEPEQVVTETVRQIVYLVTFNQKFALLYNLLTRQNLEKILIFCNRRDETRHLTDMLRKYNINCALISGEVAQNQRIKTLENFRNGKIRVLVATDVAGRGLHIDNISHVINYTLPYEPESYVHRIGRTGRAGISGTSISFADEMDSFSFPEIEEFIGEKLNCIHPDDDWLELPPPPVQNIKKSFSHTKKRSRSSRNSQYNTFKNNEH